jgi:hypothetical protein
MGGIAAAEPVQACPFNVRNRVPLVPAIDAICTSYHHLGGMLSTPSADHCHHLGGIVIDEDMTEASIHSLQTQKDRQDRWFKALHSLPQNQKQIKEK